MLDNKNREMPKRIFIIAQLFFLTGVYAIYSVVADLINGHLYINLGVFMLPVGIGLFKGKSSSRWWAKFWMILGYVLCALMMVMLSFGDSSSFSAEWFGRSFVGGDALPYGWSICFVCLATNIVLHKLLCSAKSDTYFEQADSTTESDRDLRQENVIARKSYRKFMKAFPDVDHLPSKERHEKFRRWRAEMSISE